jgi:Xaa-Pro dipeptidase
MPASAGAPPDAPSAVAVPPDPAAERIDAPPIGVAERRARIAKLQGLMRQSGFQALLVESGSTLEYFTGIRWHRSERTTAAIIPARGEVLVVTPAFEEPSVRETFEVGDDVRTWNEADDPFALIVQGLRDRGVRAGTIGVEATLRFFIVDGVRRASKDHSLVAGDALVRACRLVKSQAELALLQAANTVTIRALARVHARLQAGMTEPEIGAIMDAETAALGGAPEFSLVLLGEASAYPHGSRQAQTLRDGSVVLMDCGCSIHGYQSDISRTWVFGEPTARQRRIWNIVKRGQELALTSAELGAPVGRIDDAVRGFYEREGFGPGYRLPGLPHRTGHGIGLDGHEAPYLVHGDATPLAVGMCFSDEPGLYFPGEFGVRLEDCWHMTPSGAATFTPLAKSLDEPI